MVAASKLVSCVSLRPGKGLKKRNERMFYVGHNRDRVLMYHSDLEKNLEQSIFDTILTEVLLENGAFAEVFEKCDVLDKVSFTRKIFLNSFCRLFA